MGVVGKVFVASIGILMSMYAARYREKDRLKFLNEMKDSLGLPLEEYFDFIITRRLSDAQFSVLLLETGGTPAPLQAVPGVYSDVNFAYRHRSTPQKNAGLSENGIVDLPAAKMLGGGSSHNGMYYERGHPYGYQKWAEMTGDPSWSYKEFVQYFIKAENFMGDVNLVNIDQHGVSGPMSVTTPEFSKREIQLLQEAGAELGYATNIDPNGPQRQGFSQCQWTRDKKGRRSSAYTAYIKPIESKLRSKLTVRRYSAVQKIIFENKTAVGVIYNRHGVGKFARATKEVILSAGAFLSPIVLILSGIGPIDQLQLAKVDPVSILPVGYNLMDHPNLYLNFEIDDKSYLFDIKENLTSDQVTAYLKYGKGPINDGQIEAHIASLRGQRETGQGQPQWPDLLFFLSPDGCNFNMVRPYSRGRLTLNVSATGMEDPYLPIVDPNYYGNETDFSVSIFGIETCLKIFEQTEPFKNIGGRYADEPVKSCGRFKFRSREYWKCYIRQTASTSYHMCCSNRMGPSADGNSVVDPKFRVFGVQNLRVVDASVFPLIPNCNTAAPVVAIAEKAADTILQDYARS